MKIFCMYYCFILSIVAAVFLIGLGIALSNGYKYVHIEDKESRAVTCYIAGGIYIFFPLTMVGKYFKDNCKRKRVQVDEEIPLMDLTQINMVSN